MPTHIGAVSLTVAQLDRALAFYQEVIGLRILTRQTESASLTADGRTPLLHLHAQPHARPKPPRSIGLYHFALLTPTRLALARALQHLLASGYPLQGASDHGVSEAIYLADPDGNGIEIYRDRPRPEWPMAQGRLQMMTDPLDAAGVMAELAHAEGDRTGLAHAEGDRTGLAPETTMGHIHLHVADLARAQAFYCDLLGLALMQRYGPSAAFVAADGYHHHIGLNTWAGVGAPPPPPDAVGLRWFELVMPAVSWQAAAERLASAAYPHAHSENTLTLADPAGNGVRVMK